MRRRLLHPDCGLLRAKFRIPVTVFHSEKIEELAELLKKTLVRERAGADPFKFSSVVVPNANIAKWLRMRVFANEPALCTGVEFPFIEQAMYEALSSALAPHERASLLPMNAYAFAILGILLTPGVDALAPFARYIAGETLAIDTGRRAQARKAWQLARSLASLMDEYEVHRPEIVARWLEGKGMDGGACTDATEAAEAEVARRLFGAGGAFPPGGDALSLRQLFERVIGAGRFAPRAHYRFFAFSTLSPLQVAIMRWLAQTCEVELYHNNVCLEYWGDIDGAKALHGALDEIENPLLREWGVAGRETIEMLASLEETADASAPFDWVDASGPRARPANVLEALQRGISRRTSLLERRPQDSSLQIVAAPGIRREVEMAYNSILGIVASGEGSFSDIALLVPDIAKYRPVLDAVFAARGDVPYGLVDTQAAASSDCLGAFSALCEFVLEGASRRTIFGILDSPAVQRALGFTAADVRQWREAAGDAGAFDGFEEAEAVPRNFSWQRALARLRLGLVADDAPNLAVAKTAADGAARLGEIVELLARTLAPLAARRQTFAAWAQTLEDILSRFVDPGDDTAEQGVRAAVSDTLSSLASIGGEHPFALAAAAVEEFAGGLKERRGGYLTRGVTVASLQPMRPVPFDFVFMLGLGEAEFPGRRSETTLDMRGAKRRLGELTTPAKNRYLFLETLMAVRKRLVLSYVALDTQKDEEKFPSALISGLEDFASSAILPEGAGRWREIRLPLLEHGERGDCALADPIAQDPRGEWFGGVVATYSRAAFALRERLRDATGGKANAPGNAAGACEEPAAPPDARQLADFIIDPLDAAMRHRLGIPVSRLFEESGDPPPPLELASAGKDRAAVDQSSLAAHDGVEAALDSLAAHGRIPSDECFFGKYARKRAIAGYAAGKDPSWLENAGNFARSFQPSGEEDGDGKTRMLAIKSGEYSVRKAAAKSILPPRHALRPFISWMVKIAQAPQGSRHSLALGIVDFSTHSLATFEWGPLDAGDARAYIDALDARFRAYRFSPDSAGKYPSTGFAAIAAAMEKLKTAVLPAHGAEQEWRALASAFDPPAEYELPDAFGAFRRQAGADDWMLVRDFAECALAPFLAARHA